MKIRVCFNKDDNILPKYQVISKYDILCDFIIFFFAYPIIPLYNKKWYICRYEVGGILHMELFIITIVAIAIYFIGTKLYQKRYLKTLTEEEFKAGYRKAQLIDVREPNEFEAGHILGARNIPLSQIHARKAEIRKDMPIYLYCQSGMRSARAAGIVKKLGCTDINHLKGGFKNWTGKVKKK